MVMESQTESNTPEQSAASAAVKPHSWVLRLAAFLAVFSALQLTWQRLNGTAVEYFVIHVCTVVPAAHLANVLTPHVHARAVGFSLRAPGGGLNIENGCEGLEAFFLLAAGFIVAPLKWKSRLSGLLLGSLLVFVINQARILTLFYAYRADHALFDPLHADVAPILVILIICAYFYAWLAYSSRHVAPTG